jgi:hypothetical protein
MPLSFLAGQCDRPYLIHLSRFHVPRAQFRLGAIELWAQKIFLPQFDNEVTARRSPAYRVPFGGARSLASSWGVSQLMASSR